MNETHVYELSEHALDLESLKAAVVTNECGGIVTFLGVVRERSDGESRPVVSIAYEAYAAMAVPELRTIVAEAERGSGARVAIQHRLGVVPLGEASIAIVAAAPHRAAAFDACEFAIDEIKRRVTIWKKELYIDGGSRWTDGTPLDAAALATGDAFAPEPA